MTASNRPGPHRAQPVAPPIDPGLVYPWRRLGDWGFGSRGVAALVKAGLPALKFGKSKFFRGVDLIAVFERGGCPPDSESGNAMAISPKKHDSNGDCCRECCKTP